MDCAERQLLCHEGEFFHVIFELALRRLDQFPESLARLPVLLPTQHSPLRASLDHWFDGL